MKHTFLTLLLITFTGFCYAQDTTANAGPETVTRTNNPSTDIQEKFTVLKADKKVNQGLFQAFFHEKILVASGRYDHGVKVGTWRYNSIKGIIDQAYDYTNNKVIFARKPDTSFARFEFDTKISDTDSLTYPIKLGGNFYGYWFLIDARIDQFIKDMHNEGMSKEYICTHILNVGADGILTRWQLLVISKNFKKLYEIQLDKLSDDDKLFIPATQNGKPVGSNVYVKTKTKFF
ncbi:hypothetical protein [uncultured Mucilaginibacter sp.]|uniref:hypothetical protein n=1 Tax=uncultured Mucilaginibacter sp. TaxID=797541 RepID=UPI0025FA3D78|nr:hypothetical protein [uncultured Mucilaginibacter sp.]